MGTPERIYRRTEAGLQAWESQNSGLPVPYRRILGVLHGDTHSEMVRTVLRCYSDRQLRDWLDELDTLGFVESSPVTLQHDLDFTGSLGLSVLYAQH